MQNAIKSFDVAEKVDPSMFERVSMFEGHSLQPVNTEFLPVPDSFSAWIFTLLFFCFVLFAWLLTFNMKRVGHLFGALFGTRGFNKLTKDGHIFSEQIFVPIALLILFVFSLFAFRIGGISGFWKISGLENIAIFGQVLLGVGVIYFVKIILIKISAWIFKEQATASLYLLNLFVFNTGLTLIFLPLLLVAFFGDSWLQTNMVYAMIFLFAGWLIWRGVRSFFIINLSTKFSYVHNFLYLCTLEIGYFVLIYVILNQINLPQIGT